MLGALCGMLATPTVEMSHRGIKTIISKMMPVHSGARCIGIESIN